MTQYSNLVFIDKTITHILTNSFNFICMVQSVPTNVNNSIVINKYIAMF